MKEYPGTEKHRLIWESVISYYQTLIAEGKDFDPQLRLIRMFLDSEYWTSFHPTLSHNSLSFSYSDDYDEMQHLPLISVKYIGQRTFEVEYRSRFVGRRGLKLNCDETSLWSELESLFLRYRLEAKQQ